MLIDVHAHLDFKQFDRDREEIIGRAKRENVWIITSGIGPESIEKTMTMVKKYDNVFATLGSLPEEFNERIIEETLQLIRKNKEEIVGLGEIGVDYYWVKEEEKREKERENFQKFISLAKELSLPLVVHSRDAEGEVIDMLKEENLPALLHCFGGSLEQAEEAISFGCLISIPTSISYSKQKQLLAEKIPLEAIVLETDAPFLSPVPKTRNVPVNVKLSAKKVAEIKKVNLEMVEEITTKNAIDFFSLNL